MAPKIGITHPEHASLVEQCGVVLRQSTAFRFKFWVYVRVYYSDGFTAWSNSV